MGRLTGGPDSFTLYPPMRAFRNLNGNVNSNGNTSRRVRDRA